jgi:hypothetical protein
MFEIQCDDCGESLIIDMKETADDYSKTMNYMLDQEGKLMPDTIQNYLIYKCIRCDKVYKLTYQDWERMFREKLAWEIMEIRKQKMFSEEINPQTIHADNGMDFCGQCSGYAGDGNCFKDIIRQCTIRKNDVV